MNYSKYLSLPPAIGFAFFVLMVGVSCRTEASQPQEQSSPGVSAIRPVNADAVPAGTDTIAILHPRIVTGDGKTVIEDGAVLITGTEITAVGAFDQLNMPSGASVVDATGTTLLPGLIDAHFHLDQLDSLPNLFLQRGITSVRDPGAWISAYDGERASGLPLPRLYLTGPHLDAYPPAYPKNSLVVGDAEEARAAVEQFADRGASAIKIYFKSSLGVIRATCEAAHRRGLPVTAHLEFTNIYDAVDRGIDGIEHITSLGTTLIEPYRAEAYKQALLADYNARRNGRYTMWATIDPVSQGAEQLSLFLQEQGTFLCPTLGAFEYQPSAATTDTLRMEAFRHMMEYTKRLHDTGVKVVLGSHSHVRYSEYGWAYHHEMELFQQLGMTPLEIVHASTLQNARFFRIDDHLGSIEAGKLADLILVTGNPLENIATLRQIKGVMLGGKWVLL